MQGVRFLSPYDSRDWLKAPRDPKLVVKKVVKVVKKKKKDGWMEGEASI